MVSLIAFAIAQWHREGGIHIEDAYKWLFQATLGGEHAISSTDEVRSWMDNEWATLGPPEAGEPLTVSMRPDGKLLRVNMRPYKVAGGSKEALLRVFVESARDFRADKRLFVRTWKAFGQDLYRAGRIGGITESDWERLDAEVRPTYPAIEHSEVYLKEMKPAYRVVERKFWDGLAKGLKRSRT